MSRIFPTAGVSSGIALLVGLTVGAAPQAHAAPAGCPSGAVCVYSEYFLRGTLRAVYADTTDRVHDIKSVINMSACDVVFRADRSGAGMVVPRGHQVPRVSPHHLDQGSALIRWDCS